VVSDVEGSMMNETSNYLEGRLQLLVEPSEMRMSHWIDNPKVVDTRTGRSVLDLHGSLWDLMEITELPTSIVLRMRKYPGTSAPVELALSIDRPGGVLDGRLLDDATLLAALESHA
jgi:hypothetical protein